MSSPAEVDIKLVSPCGSPATEADLAQMAQDLGRVPRGVWAIGARDREGMPLVAVTMPRLDDGTPFPTLFYLTSPELTKACSTLEAEHFMEELAERLRDDVDFGAAYARAHDDYLRRRACLGDVPEIENFSAGGMPDRVKCIHAVVAHSLAVGPGVNPAGDAALAQMKARGLWPVATSSTEDLV